MAKKKKTIDSLTKEQEEQLGVWAQKWNKIGLCTDPINEEKAKAALIKAYKAAGFEPPKEWIVLPSPYKGAMKAMELNGGQYVAPFFGCHESNWLGFYEFFGEVLDMKEEVAPVEGLIEYAKHGGWAWLFTDVAIMTDRPAEIHLDAQGRLHCENSMAFKWRDGTGDYVWHNVRVPEKLIMHPESISPDDILSEKNAEIRRVMIERFGRDRFVKLPKTKLVHKDEWGELYHHKIDDTVYAFIKVVNSTPDPSGEAKEYILRVNPEHKTARAAVASTQPRIENFAPIEET